MSTFMSNHPGITYVLILISVLAAMVIYYGNMVATVVKWSQKPRWSKDHKRIRMNEIPLQMRLKCYIPVFQCCIVNKTLWGSYGPWMVTSILSVVLILIRLLNAFVIGINPYVMFFTSIGIYLGLLLMIVTYAVVTARVAYAYGFSFLMVLLSVVLSPIAAWYMSTHIPGKMKALYKEETFHEHKSDTVIKRRSNE